MDRNTLTGLLLMTIILIGFSFYMQPSESELQQLQKQEDSIKAAKANSSNTLALDTIAQKSDSSIVKLDTSNVLSAATAGKEELVVIENEKIKATISTKGGSIVAVELKEYKTWDKKPLFLFDQKDSKFNLSYTVGNDLINTSDLYFQKIGSSFEVLKKDSNTLTMRLASKTGQYLDFVYTLKGDSYLIDFDIKSEGMNNIISNNTGYYDLSWHVNSLKNEKDMKMERNNTTVYYKYDKDDVDYISPSKSENIKLESSIKWASFKQHFFSSVLIADETFSNGVINTNIDLSSEKVKDMTMNLSIPIKRLPSESFGMNFYFGPNQYNILAATGNNLEKQINLGWGPLKYINRYAVIPIFNSLEKMNLNYGIIILILTIILKLVLSPLTYRSYLSTAKMRILKPEMDEIKAKVGEDDQTKLQQEYMKLYKKAGVNPLGGCVPLLLQMPILFAFFFFFPSSIELRQQSFLWVGDLSTYDAIFSWGEIPIISTIYGNHVSLMCILMTASTLIYTRLNNQISGATGQMKWMGYLMPIVFMGVLNNVAAGLNYYYFVANMMTFGQQWLIRKFVDDSKLHKQIQENKKKPASAKKSKFQQKLEDMQREREKQLKAKK
jgi:YidC/Oxa1 family membrane protein insertase